LDRAPYAVETALEPDDLVDELLDGLFFEGDASVPALAQAFASAVELFFRQWFWWFVDGWPEDGHRARS
jgi:hypothetical protein